MRTIVYKLKNKVKNKMLKIIIKNDKIEKIMLDAPEAGQAAQDLHAIEQTAQATLAEFEKVEAIRASTARALDAAESKTRELLGELAAQM